MKKQGNLRAQLFAIHTFSLKELSHQLSCHGMLIDLGRNLFAKPF